MARSYGRCTIAATKFVERPNESATSRLLTHSSEPLRLVQRSATAGILTKTRYSNLTISSFRLYTSLSSPTASWYPPYISLYVDLANSSIQDEEGRRILKATPYARKASEQGSEDWNGYTMQILKALRSADKANWHHRMVARVSLLSICKKNKLTSDNRPLTFSMTTIQTTRELLLARKRSSVSRFLQRPCQSKFGNRTMSEQEDILSTRVDMSDSLQDFCINSTIRLT